MNSPRRITISSNGTGSSERGGGGSISIGSKRGEDSRGGKKREGRYNPSNWLFASLNYVILRIPREARNSAIKENPSVVVCRVRENARLLLLCRPSISIVSDRPTFVAILGWKITGTEPSGSLAV